MIHQQPQPQFEQKQLLQAYSYYQQTIALSQLPHLVTQGYRSGCLPPSRAPLYRSCFDSMWESKPLQVSLMGLYLTL